MTEERTATVNGTVVSVDYRDDKKIHEMNILISVQKNEFIPDGNVLFHLWRPFNISLPDASPGDKAEIEFSLLRLNTPLCYGKSIEAYNIKKIL